MITVHEPERSVLHGTGARAQVLYRGADDVRVELDTDPGRGCDGVAAGLLCAAVLQARARHARRVRTVLDASAPSGAACLAALRTRLGEEIGDITMRRAGSSVLVTLELLPAPAAPTAPAPAHAGTRAGQDARPAARHSRTARRGTAVGARTGHPAPHTPVRAR